MPRAYCHPANEFCSWARLSTKEGHRPSAQSYPENAGPYGRGFTGPSVGSASHATHPVLAEAEPFKPFSSHGLVSRTPPRNGDLGLCISPGPLEGPFLAKVRRDTAHRRKVVTTDASNKGWGALCEGKPTFGHWSEEESGLYTNCLKMLAVCQACQFFLPDILVRSAGQWCHTHRLFLGMVQRSVHFRHL